MNVRKRLEFVLGQVLELLVGHASELSLISDLITEESERDQQISVSTYLFESVATICWGSIVGW